MTDDLELADAEARFARLRDREPELSQAWQSVVHSRAALVDHRNFLAIANDAFAEAEHAWTLVKSRQLQPSDNAHTASVTWHRAHAALRAASAVLMSARAGVEKAELAEKLADAEFIRVRESTPSVRRAWHELMVVRKTRLGREN